MPWMHCPECQQEGWFNTIGRVRPITYECRRCGNIERGIECADCGSTTAIRSGWRFYNTHCRSCGSKKAPVWSE